MCVFSQWRREQLHGRSEMTWLGETLGRCRQVHDARRTQTGTLVGPRISPGAQTHTGPLPLSAEPDLACGGNSGDPDTPTQSDGEDGEEEPLAPLASTSEDLSSDLEISTGTIQLRDGLMEVMLCCIFCCTNLFFKVILDVWSLVVH